MKPVGIIMQGLFIIVFFQFFSQLFYLFFQLQYPIEGTQRYIENGITGIKTQQILVQETYGGLPSFFYRTFIGQVLRGEYFKQGWFSGAIITDQANAFIGLNLYQ